MATCRVQIIDKAKKIIRSLVAPEMMPNYHGLNVRPSIFVPFGSVPFTILLLDVLSSLDWLFLRSVSRWPSSIV